MKETFFLLGDAHACGKKEIFKAKKYHLFPSSKAAAVLQQQQLAGDIQRESGALPRRQWLLHVCEVNKKANVSSSVEDKEGTR